MQEPFIVSILDNDPYTESILSSHYQIYAIFCRTIL